jgi:hypothetical protein
MCLPFCRPMCLPFCRPMCLPLCLPSLPSLPNITKQTQTILHTYCNEVQASLAVIIILKPDGFTMVYLRIVGHGIEILE